MFILCSCVTNNRNYNHTNKNTSTNKITTAEWLEKNKNDPVLRNGNGQYYKVMLNQVLDPNHGKLIDAKPMTLTEITKTMNDFYSKNFTEKQIVQIYNISNEKNINITYVVDNCKISKNGNVILNNK